MPTNGSAEWKEGVDYNCRVEGIQALESSNTSTPYLGIKCIVIDGEMSGETFTFEAYATDGAKTRLERTLAVLGFIVGKSSFDDIATIVVGKECAVTFKADTYQKKTKMKPDNLKRRSAADQPGGVMGRIAALFGEKLTVAAGPKHDEVPF